MTKQRTDLWPTSAPSRMADKDAYRWPGSESQHTGAMKTTGYRRAPSLESGIKVSASASGPPDWTIVIVILSVSKPDEPIRAQDARHWAAYLNDSESCRAHRRVFVPFAQLLREGLPEPLV